MTCRRTWLRIISTAFAAASMFCALSCAGPTNPGAESAAEPPDTIEIVREGDPAPGDGFWMSRRTFLTLYEAAERTAALERAPARETD